MARAAAMSEGVSPDQETAAKLFIPLEIFLCPLLCPPGQFGTARVLLAKSPQHKMTVQVEMAQLDVSAFFGVPCDQTHYCALIRRQDFQELPHARAKCRQMVADRLAQFNRQPVEEFLLLLFVDLQPAPDADFVEHIKVSGSGEMNITEIVIVIENSLERIDKRVAPRPVCVEQCSVYVKKYSGFFNHISYQCLKCRVPVKAMAMP